MPWTSLPKDLTTTQITPHKSTSTAVIARPPGSRTLNFTPAEFFGAGARCSNLHIVNPSLVTPESQVIQSLVEQHVDNSSADFAVLQSADNFKDFVKSYFAGTVASGLAYLAMINDGYVWSDHFENIGGGNTTATRTPDFVFARAGQNDVALMESKGTRSAAPTSFDKTVKDGYVGQIEPHLGHRVGTATATHGFSIGAWLTSTARAELNIHHTDAVAATSTGGSPPGSIASIQQNNYATAFRLAHSEELSRQIRTSELDAEIPFFQFEWLGRKWLTSCLPDEWSYRGGYEYFERLQEIQNENRDLAFGLQQSFAVERTNAEAILKALSSSREADDPFDLQPLPDGLRREARGGEGGSAVFPDGLAFSFDNFPSSSRTRIVLWERGKSCFRVFDKPRS
ncbi:MAG TPA: hypothetical protein VN838_21985 [Bradyrhizobium sp.]|nr:hypothetical protein [Bradyrhizobium sp.]